MDTIKPPKSKLNKLSELSKPHPKIDYMLAYFLGSTLLYWKSRYPKPNYWSSMNRKLRTVRYCSMSL